MKYQVDRKTLVKSILFDNLSYKIVSLFVALILWISILGRRDFVTIKEMDIKFILPPGLMISAQSHDRLKVKLSGSQPLLKKYKDEFKKITFDLSDQSEGVVEVDIPNYKIDVPQGVKVLSIRPNVIKLDLEKEVK